MSDRLRDFIRAYLGSRAEDSLISLKGDASVRRYYRYRLAAGESFILTLYPEPFDADRFPFQEVYDLFLRIGIPVPKIHEVDGRLGVVLQQDLGDHTLHDTLWEGPAENRRRRLRQAIRYLILIQGRGTSLMRPEISAAREAFDVSKLSWELEYFRKHYWTSHRGRQTPQGLDSEFHRLVEELAGRPRWLCHRDYHVRNLMDFEGELYVIDFQDARQGPVSYDLVSLLKDSVDLPPSERREYEEFYLSESLLAPDRSPFLREYRLMSIQRLLKALGTYGNQITLRQNRVYERFIPGTLARLREVLDETDDFPVLRAAMEADSHLPGG